MAKIEYVRNEEEKEVHLVNIAVGTIFSWGARTEWHLKTDDGAFSLSDGLEAFSTSFGGYIEAEKVIIKAGD